VGRAARLTGFAIATLLAMMAAGFFVLPFVVRGFIRGLELTVNACVWFAASLSAGADMWTIVAAVGRAVGSALVSPQAFVIVGGLVLAGVLALYGLQRLLGSDGDASPRGRGR
jgi:hypothetical protein